MTISGTDNTRIPRTKVSFLLIKANLVIQGFRVLKTKNKDSTCILKTKNQTGIKQFILHATHC